MAKKKAVRKKAVAKKKAPAKRKSSAPKIEDDGSTVEELLEQLASTEDQGEKRRLRSRLRSRGHEGGLRAAGVVKEKAVAKKATRKKATKKKVGRRRKAAATDD